MKIILVSGCFNCPHGARFDLEGTEYLCDQLLKVNNNPTKPLPECKLDDATKKITAPKQPVAKGAQMLYALRIALALSEMEAL